MPTSTVSFIYEIAYKRYNMEVDSSNSFRLSWDSNCICIMYEQITLFSVGLSINFLSKPSVICPKQMILRVPKGREKERVPSSACFPSIYMIEGNPQSSFLSNDGFVSHHYFTFATTSICLCCVVISLKWVTLPLTLSW